MTLTHYKTLAKGGAALDILAEVKIRALRARLWVTPERGVVYIVFYGSIGVLECWSIVKAKNKDFGTAILEVHVFL